MLASLDPLKSSDDLYFRVSPCWTKHIYDYRDFHEKYLGSKIRILPKDFTIKHVDEDFQESPITFQAQEAPFWRAFEIVSVINYFDSLSSQVPEFEKNEKYIVCIVEGEKDVGTLKSLGFEATCPFFTSIGIREKDVCHFEKARVVLFYDKDDAGKKCRDKNIARLKGKVQSLRVVDLPGDFNDISDYVEFKQKEFEAEYDQKDLSEWTEEKRVLVQKDPEIFKKEWVREALRKDVQWLINQSEFIREDENVVLPGEEVEGTQSKESLQTIPNFEEEKKRPYPIDSYPPKLREGILALSAKTQFPLESCAALVRSVLGFILGNKFKVFLTEDIKVSPCRFFLILGESGEYKSTAFREVLRPIEKVEEEEEEGFQDKMDAYQLQVNEMEDLEKKMRRTSDDAKKELLKEEVLFLKKRLRNAEPLPNGRMSNHLTGAALHKQICDCKGWLYYYNADGGKVLDTILGKGDGTDGSLNDSYILSYVCGESVTTHRRGRGKKNVMEGVKDPALSVCLCIQPDRAEEFLNHRMMRSGGMINRMSIVKGVSLMGKRVRRPVVKNKKALAEMLDDFGKIYKEVREDVQTHHIRFSEGADSLLDEYYDKIEKMLPEGEKGEDIRGLLCRATCRVVQTALQFEHSLTDGKMSCISVESVKGAIEVEDYEMEETASILRKGDEDPTLTLAKKCFQKLSTRKPLKEGNFTKKQFHQAFSNDFTKHRKKYKDLKVVDEVLEMLVEWQGIEVVDSLKKTYRIKG